MLRVKVILFLQSEKVDDTGFHQIDIYNRKISSMLVPSPMDISEHGAKTVLLRHIKGTLERLYEDIEVTLEAESKYDLDYVCDKNCNIWSEE